MIKNKYIFPGAIFALALFMLTSCQDAVDYDPNMKTIYIAADHILPLKSGNTWIYKVSSFNSLGDVEEVFYDTVAAYPGADGWFTLKDQNNVVYKLFGGTALKNMDNGLYARIGLADLYIDKLVFEYPASIGDELAFENSVIINEDTCSMIRKVNSLDEKLTVPAGEFSCIKYWDKALTKESEIVYNPWNIFYFTPKTGMVKSIRYENSRLGNVYVFQKLELVKYTLNDS